MVSALRAIYTAPTEQATEQALADFTASELQHRAERAETVLPVRRTTGTVPRSCSWR
ncbi:hypothetical protein ABZ464_41220 [Streptomyces sp. NPDC005820]|uniref:hypothetical protein n=1 Tax=Streptomyces sp. NPDC005820 TaxID=3157069 RepID=UPI0033F6192F